MWRCGVAAASLVRYSSTRGPRRQTRHLCLLDHRRDCGAVWTHMFMFALQKHRAAKWGLETEQDGEGALDFFFFLRPVHVWWSAVRWGEIYFLPLLRFSSCLWLRSHIWTPAGHARSHFSIPAIYCNALQMLPVVCVYVLRGVTSRGRQNTSLRLRGDGYQKVNSAKCICTALQEE